MRSTLEPAQNDGIRDGSEFRTGVPTRSTTSNGLLDDIQDLTATTSEQQSQEPSLGKAIGRALVLVGATWLAAEILGEIFGSGADLTAVEQQILASP